MTKADKRNFARFIDRNLGNLARACWMAAEWEATGAEADRVSNPEGCAAQIRDQRRMLRIEKTLRRYMAKRNPTAAPGA